MTGQSDAAFTFDYLSLLAVSSTIAAIGLASDSVVVIVASSEYHIFTDIQLRLARL